MPGDTSEPGGKKVPAESGKSSATPSPTSSPSPWAIAFGAGSEIVVSVLGGFFLGQWLDGKFGTEPWLMMLGSILGITLGLYQLIKATTKRSGRR